MNESLMQRFVSARRRYIEEQFNNLNDMQMEAAMTTEGPLLLLAGAGSGKTTVLINRIANLMRFGRGSDTTDVPDTITEEDVTFLEGVNANSSELDRSRADLLCAVEPVLPWNIIAITFTNKAANELKERLTQMLGASGNDVWAMTFHSACCRILRRDIERIGYSRNFTIYDAADSERVLKNIIKDMGLDDKTFPARYIQTIISREKDNMTTPEDLMERADSTNDLRLRHIARIYGIYQKQLKENNALDFDDIILNTVLLLQQNDDVRSYYQRKFRYVLVDEYQDTNHLQYLLTSMLAGGYENICVVGDDDQSIYRFRGATIANILDFEKQYYGSRVIRLEQNYRSTQSILNAANAVIANNIGRKGKRLWTANPSGSPVTLYEAYDEAGEADYISSQILSGAKQGKGFSKYAILYRTNAQSNALEYSFRKNGIAYRVIGGTRFFERAEIKDMLAYLCVINNRNDDLRLRRIVNNPPRGLGDKTLDVVNRLATAEGMGLYHVISDPYSYGPLEKVAAKLLRFSAIIEDLAKLLLTDISLVDFYEEVMIRTGYAEMLQLKPTEENKTRLENIRELKSSIAAYVQNAEEPTLAGFLEEIALYTDIEQYNDSEDAVVMMTMHSAKGLEFPNVFLVGFEEGLFPGIRCFGDRDEMEEERRLCYVAITRARENLTISYARQRMLYGKTNASLPSRFLKEIPDEIVERKGGYHRPQTATYTYSSASYSAPKSATTPRYEARTEVKQLELQKGDMVEHKSFGRGMVLSVLKMGGDSLLEIAFDQIGTKKLMSKTASAYMKKL